MSKWIRRLCTNFNWVVNYTPLFYCLVYVKFLLLRCIGSQVKDDYCTSSSLDNIRIRDMLAQLLKTEETLTTVTFAFHVCM